MYRAIEHFSKDLSAMDAVPGEVERLKWVGIYPQKQGGDAFMMRIKNPWRRPDAGRPGW